MLNVNASPSPALDASRQAPRQPPLSPEKRAEVFAVLEKYDANALSGSDVEAIKKAFSAAGIQRGPALREAIASAGFNPADLHPERTEAGPAPRPANLEQLQTLKDILGGYDLANLSADDRSALVQRLKEAGWDRPGSIIHRSA
ncbi:hypothetical protein [Inhella gelatinilytica]|uniref:Uncharacterized protein n=1 Tax=Inhella gelatinilytica TaxID=2795030 RepID=A0A931NFS4_9BURK|nr:hypothetical protein [Inhella gelatinilytica]MBH9553851.1 hypothetical protein [Inhella gelatinilytica]